MSIFNQMQPASVLQFFEALCAIPHGSGNTKAVSDYCVNFAKERGLQVRQDAANNVIIVKEASAGYEDIPTVILQGHLDMVCEKEPGCDLDMRREGLRLQTDGVYAWAEGTTLGGDDGIAVAMALAVLDDAELQHPRLEAVLTADEEVGLLGAAKLDTSDLRGKYLLNIDSEVEGVLTVSCAGGVRAACHVPIQWEETCGIHCSVFLDGLTGGHSGVEIHRGRANANVLLGRLLYGILQEMPMGLTAMSGGQAENAIAAQSCASFVVPAEEAARVRELVCSYGDVFAREYQTTEPGLKVTFSFDSVSGGMAVCPEDTKRVISMLMLLPNGIQSMSMDIPGLVQTSLNLGVLRLSDTEATAMMAIRSSVATEKAMICNRIDCLGEQLNFTVTYTGDYPAWEYRKESKLRDLTVGIYESQTGKKPIIEAIHAGLECGVFSGKMPELDCISFGPNLLDIHTPRERMDLASVARTWNLLCEILRCAGELA